MKATQLAVASLVGLVFAGCGALRPAPTQPPSKVAIGFGRVAIVEFYNRTPYSRPAQQFTELLREKLTEWTVSTDVIVIPRDALPALGDPLVCGRIPLNVLVEIRERHLADAVIIGSVDDHNPYWKPSVHVTLKVIDTASAEFPYELSDGWEAGCREVRDEIDSYYRRNYGKDDCRFGPELFVTSPSYFLRFVADRVAQRLTAAL
ncbi:MAG: hypothetical protein KAX19_12635 [Candidatus Brocadiae bacterium]|nr:hypothetical protein [Candidatus Brocadiia bacterium]